MGSSMKVYADSDVIPDNQMPQKVYSDDEVTPDSTSQSSSLFTESNIQPQSYNESSPLSLSQQVVMSLAPDNKTRLKYLAEKFSGSQVDQDDSGNIRIDGRRINPEGFQFGADIAGNSGYALPFAGQVAGGIMGGTAGSVVPGAGTTAGAIGGGVAGAATGEAARLGLGAMAGLNPSAESTLGSVGTEAAFGLGGELATRGIFKATQKAAQITGADKAIANAWRKSMNKLGKFAPEIAEFVGGVDKDAVKLAQKHGFNNTFTPNYFSEDKMQRVVKNTLFQDEAADLLKLSATKPELNGLQEGAVRIAKSVRDINDPAYDSLIKKYAGLSDETIDTLKHSSLAEVFSKSNLADDHAFKLASQFEDMAKKRLKTIGEELGQSEAKAIANSKFKTMAVDDLGQQLNSIIKEVRGNIKVPGFQATKQYRIPGLNELEAMKNALGGYVKDDLGNKQFRFFGEEIKTRGGQIKKVLDRPSLKQLSKRLGSIDNIADALYSNKNVSPKVKVAARDWLRQIRGRYDNLLGLEEKSATYSAFKDVVNNANIDRSSFLASFEGQIKNFRKITGAQRNSFNTVLENLDQRAAGRLTNQIDIMNAGQELRKFDTQKVVSALEGQLNSKNLLSSIKYGTDESVLKQIDGLMKNSKSPMARKAVFMDETEKTLAAREFLKGSPNLLRVGALTSMIGGFSLGGPVGALAGIAVSQPRNIARGLSAIERGVSLPQPVQRGIRGATQAVPAEASRVLQGLLRSKDQR